MTIPPIKFRVLKSWVSRDFSLILQVQTLTSRETSGDLPKKMYLALDIKQQSFGLRLSREKPGDATANHAFVQILRKYCPSFTIRWIHEEAETGTLWIPLLAGSEHGNPWMLRLLRSKPPLLSLISPDRVIQVSFGQKGTFTKKHTLETGMPEQGLDDIMPRITAGLWSASAGSSRRAVDSDEPDEVVAAAPANAEARPLADGRDPTEASPISHRTPSRADPAPAGFDETTSKAQRELLGRLKRKLKTVRKTRDKLLQDLPSVDELQHLEQCAHFLQSYAYLLQEDSIALNLEPAITGLPTELVIPLDPELSRGRQIELAFAAYRKAKRGREIGRQQLEIAEANLRSLEHDIRQLLDTAVSDQDLGVLIRRYKLPELSSPSSTGSRETSAKPYKTYRASTGHTILVGKGAMENDELTKAARSNDYWFHAVGVTGSHVIVPVTPDIREALPTQLMREAAILALHFSRFKEDRAGECYLSRKAYLKKQKGMPPGLWRIDQSESVFFRYTQAELESLLQTIQI